MADGFQGPPAADFYSMLSGLGDTIKANQVTQAKRDAFAQATAPGPNGQVDYGRAMLGLAQVDPQAAALFSAAQNHQDTLKQQDRDFGFRQTEAQRAQQNSDRSYGIQVRTADRLDEGPVEQAGYREAVARKYNLDPASPEGRAFIVSGKLPDSIANGGQPEVGLNPAYGVGSDGKVGAIQFSKTGKAVQTQLPEGFTLSKEPIRVDAGTHINLIDPITRQVVGTLPKNVAEVERQKVVGDAQGQGQVALPQVMATSQQILKTISDVKNHPGKDWSLGMYSKVPTIPGTEQANFRVALGQLQGQTFLQAYQTLRGGGAITDIEGQKGTAALNRMNMAQTKEEFDKAADDFADVVKGGMLRAAAKAQGPSAGAAPQAAASTQPNVTKSGVPWSIQ